MARTETEIVQPIKMAFVRPVDRNPAATIMIGKSIWCVMPLRDKNVRSLNFSCLNPLRVKSISGITLPITTAANINTCKRVKAVSRI